jgi:hypothetical protein
LERTISPVLPYPGLRPFTAEESGIFFGREEQTDELLAKLQTHHFIAVTGPSGCGKSSLVRAGLIPALRAGFMMAAGSRWRVCELRPGQHPILSMAMTLATPEVLGADHDEPPFIEAALRFGPLGLTQIVRESALFGDASLVIIVDQFEEIFRFRERIDPDEADAFVRLLLTSAGAADVPIYVVITMRSDYLGDCALFHGLPEAINAGQYLTPRLTRSQCAAAVVGPARVCNGEVDGALVNRLLNDFGPDPDQLPLLQHALMRMWIREVRQYTAGATTSLYLTVEDYEAVGGLADALSRHADEALAELEPEKRHLAEVMFRRLTERGSGRRDTRAPARVGEIAAIGGVTVDEVAAVAQVFARQERHFVTLPGGPVTEETLLDIGHESLIRQWGTLAAWVAEEAESATAYKRLVDFARLWKANAAGLWRPPELDLALAWNERQHPNAAWAARYAPPEDFPVTMEFLEASRQAWEAEQSRAAQREEQERQRERERIEQAAQRERLEALAKAAAAETELERTKAAVERQMRRNRLLRVTALVLAIGIVGLLLFIANYRRMWVSEDVAFFSDVVKKFGVPSGIGTPLPSNQVKRRGVNFKLVKRGVRGPVIRMESVDSAGRYASQNVSAAGYFGDSSSTEANAQAVRWEYIYDVNGAIASEAEFNARGAQVGTTMYIPSADPRRRTAHFFGARGEPFLSSGSCAAYFHIEFSPEGYEQRLRYMDRRGRPAPGRDNAYQIERRYDAAGHVTETISLDQNGKRMNDMYGNAVYKARYDEHGNEEEATLLDERGAVTIGSDGWAIRRLTYDANGNPTSSAVFDEAGRPIVDREGSHRRSWEQDANGLFKSERYWGIKGEPVAPNGCHGIRVTRDSHGRIETSHCVGPDGRPQPEKSIGVPEWRLKYDDDSDNVIEYAFFDADGQPATSTDGYHREVAKRDEGGHVIELEFLGTDGKHVTRRGGYSRINMVYQEDNEVRRVYRDANGSPVLFDDLYAEIRREYDRDGKLTRESYFDATGQPRPQSEGSSGMRFVYDECGRRTERWYLGPDGNPVETKGKYAAERYELDNLGRTRRLTYLATSGSPTLGRDLYAGFEARYDALGNRIEERYFDTAGKPVRCQEGYAGHRKRYDSRRNVTLQEYLGPDGKPETNIEVRRKEHSFDGGNRLVQSLIWHYLPESNQLLGIEQVTYDERGNKIKELYFKEDRQPLVRTIEKLGNCAGIVFRYDAAGKVSARECLGADGQPRHR